MNNFTNPTQEWFLAWACTSPGYGLDSRGGDALRAHVTTGCGLIWNDDPCLGEYYPTPDQTSACFYANVSCSCGLYLFQELYVSSGDALDNIIADIITGRKP